MSYCSSADERLVVIFQRDAHKNPAKPKKYGGANRITGIGVH